MLRLMLLLLIALIVLVLVAQLVGHWRWTRITAGLRHGLESARTTHSPGVVDFRELAGLPAPVARYFRAVLTDGQSIVAAAQFHHSGTFNMGEAADRWAPFTSDQLVVTQRPGFDWDGRIVMAPGLAVRVHDAYVGGEGLLNAAIFGLITVSRMEGTRAIDEGELMRFVAEAAWYPTALLPSQGVAWSPIDDRSARATLRDGDHEVTLVFVFDDADLIATVSSPGRGRTIKGETLETPWQGTFWNYTTRSGMLIPTDGEVSWLLPDGPKPYWRGHLENARYEFNR